MLHLYNYAVAYSEGQGTETPLTRECKAIDAEIEKHLWCVLQIVFTFKRPYK